MKESEQKIPIDNGNHTLYSTLRGDYANPLVILCHGYGGWMHEMLLFNAARHFEKAGFSTLRLSMYGGGENARKITESDVKTHASDIDDVVRFVKSAGANWIGVAGHSYSGLAILYSKEQAFNAAALWDPTHTDGYEAPQAKASLRDDFIFVPEINAYVSGFDSGYVYAKTVFDNEYPKSREVAAEFNTPSLIINASWSKEQQAYGKDYAATINATTKHVVIPDSSHPFTEDGATEKLFAETETFFKMNI